MGHNSTEKKHSMFCNASIFLLVLKKIFGINKVFKVSTICYERNFFLPDGDFIRTAMHLWGLICLLLMQGINLQAILPTRR